MYNLAMHELFESLWQTLYMVSVSGLLSMCIGLGVGLALFLSSREKNNSVLLLMNRALNILVNVFRAVPFIILMIVIIPFTRALVGTSIGTTAAIVPLTIAAIPFFARLVEEALREIPLGITDTAYSLGATQGQLVRYFLLPEASSALVAAGTTTIINLIGYSAMAGAVGGGGLGELAIDYGYQQFNLIVMLETVVLLVLLVQLCQYVGDSIKEAKRKGIGVVAFFVFSSFCLGIHVWPQWRLEQQALRVGIMSGSSEQVMKVAQAVAKSNYHLPLKIVTFNDYILPNTALNNGDIDVNIFQHQPFLDIQQVKRDTHLMTIGKTFVYPMGLFSKTIHHISELKSGALVAIPSDPSNQARTLLLLQQAGLIQLSAKKSTQATVHDIISNKKQLIFKTLSAAQLPRVLNDATLVALTNDFISPAGFTLNQAIIKEKNDSPYANIIVARKAHALLQTQLNQLVKVMHSKPVIRITNKIYPHGAAIPAWV